MNKHLHLLLAVLLLFIAPVFTRAQEIVTVAGVGIEGWTGDKGPAVSAAMDWPSSVAVDRYGNLYIADANNNIIRKVKDGVITTVVGTGYRAGTGEGSFSGDGGPASAATLFFPSGVAVDTLGRLFIADQGNNCIREVDTNDTITTVAGTGGAGNFGYMGDGAAANLALLNSPARVAVDTSGNIYIADSHNSVIREVTLLTGDIATIAGTGVTGYGGDGGPAVSAQLSWVNDVAVDRAGNVYIADTYNNLIREVDLTGNINTIAGSGIAGYSGNGGPATVADLFQPSGIAVDTFGNVFFSEVGNNDVRKISVTDSITAIAGVDSPGFNGDDRYAPSAKLWYPEGLTVIGTNVYIADRGNFRVRETVPHNYGLAVANINRAKESISLFPNPSQGSFTIAVNTVFNEQAHIVITNLTGEQLNNSDAPTNTPVNINLAQPPGIYFVSAITAHGVLNEKLIIN